MLSSAIVVGLGFGDEGKGLVTSFLCSQATFNPIVVRFNGGHQAGHTVVYNGKRHVFSSFGSGTLQGIPTYWSKHCTVYPIAFMNEGQKLDNTFEIYLDPLCPVTTPWDVVYNQAVARKNGHGSVGVGFGATLERHEKHYKLFVQDLFHRKIMLEKIKMIIEYYNSMDIGIDFSEVDFNLFLKGIDYLCKYAKMSDQVVLQDKTCIYEGAQGILLDQDFGVFPHVTRSSTTTKVAREMVGGMFYEVFYVTRAYQTRHGNGFMTNVGQPVKLVNDNNETNKQHDFQGEFRKTPLDIDLLKYALQCDSNYSHDFSVGKNLVITCMDQVKISVEDLQKRIGMYFTRIFISEGPALENIKQITGYPL